MDANEHQLLPHWHPYIEFIYVMEGMGKLLIDLRVYEAAAGDILIVSPNSIHAAVGEESHPLQCKVIIADLEMIMGKSGDETVRNYTNPLVEQKIKIIPKVCKANPFYFQLKEMYDEIMNDAEEKKPGYELYVKGNIMRLLGLLFREEYYIEEVENFGIKDVQRVKRAIEYIETHLSEKISLEELAQFTGYSRHYFMHFFKQYTGYTVTQYVNLKRTDLAAHLLDGREWGVTEISEKAGYQDVSYFIRVFSKRFGMPPLCYRKKIRERQESK